MKHKSRAVYSLTTCKLKDLGNVLNKLGDLQSADERKPLVECWPCHPLSYVAGEVYADRDGLITGLMWQHEKDKVTTLRHAVEDSWYSMAEYLLANLSSESDPAFNYKAELITLFKRGIHATVAAIPLIEAVESIPVMWRLTGIEHYQRLSHEINDITELSDAVALVGAAMFATVQDTSQQASKISEQCSDYDDDLTVYTENLARCLPILLPCLRIIKESGSEWETLVDQAVNA